MLIFWVILAYAVLIYPPVSKTEEFCNFYGIWDNNWKIKRQLSVVNITSNFLWCILSVRRSPYIAQSHIYIIKTGNFDKTGFVINQFESTNQRVAFGAKICMVPAIILKPAQHGGCIEPSRDVWTAGISGMGHDCGKLLNTHDLVYDFLNASVCPCYWD